MGKPNRNHIGLMNTSNDSDVLEFWCQYILSGGGHTKMQDPSPHLLSEDDIVLHELPGQRHGVADVHVVVPRPVDHLTANQSSVLRPAVDQ